MRVQFQDSAIRWVIPGLLFRQYCLLSCLCGVLAFKHLLASCLCFLVLALASWSRQRAFLGIVVLLFCWGLGLGFMAWRSPPALVLPDWAVEASTARYTDTGARERGTTYSKGLRIRGTVVKIDSLPDQRLRLFLAAVVPADAAGAQHTPLPGTLVWTWKDPISPLPGQGQVVELTLRLRQQRSFKNYGGWDIEQSWLEQGAVLRAWCEGDAADIAIFGEADSLWRFHALLRNRTVQALQQADMWSAALWAWYADQPAPVVENVATESAFFTDTLGQSAAVILALLFGDRFYLEQVELDRVAAASLAHSLALSGMHLGYVAFIGIVVALLIAYRYPPILLRIPFPRLCLFFSLPLTCFYLWLGGAEPSLLRSFLMLCFFSMLLWRGRPYALMDALLWAVAIMVLWQPLVVYDLRLQLSALSIGALALFAPALLHLHRSLRVKRIPRIVHAFIIICATSFIAQAALFPLLAYTFGTASPWFFLNALWLPILALIVMPLAFFALFCAGVNLIFFAGLAFFIAGIFCQLLLSGLQWLEGAGLLMTPLLLRPLWTESLGFLILLMLTPVLLQARHFTRQTGLLAGMGMLLLCFAPLASLWKDAAWFGRTATLQVLDVGQGQAVVIGWTGADSGRILVDGGGFSVGSFDTGKYLVSPFLTYNSAPRLHAVVNTHPDVDHLRGLLHVVENIAVARYAHSGTASSNLVDAQRLQRALRHAAVQPEIWHAGMAFSLGEELMLEVLFPPKETALTGNSASLVLRLVHKGHGLVLLTGDIDSKSIPVLLASGVSLQADVLLLAHHGSGNSYSEALYVAVSPRIAIASCAWNNQFGFPRPNVRAYFAARDIPLLTTGASGQLALEWELEQAPYALRVEAAREQ